MCLELSSDDRKAVILDDSTFGWDALLSASTFQLMILRGRRMRSSKLDCRYSYRFLSVRIARNLDRSCSGGTEGPCSCLANETVLGNGRLGVRLPNRRLQLGNWYTVIVLSVSTGSSAYSYQSLGQIFVSKMTWPFHCSEDLNKLKLPYM